MKLAPDDRDACRLAFAAIAMHALLRHAPLAPPPAISGIAVQHADALLAALEEPPPMQSMDKAAEAAEAAARG